MKTPSAVLPRLTDTDIVTMLRDASPELRRQALEALFPHSTGAVLVTLSKTETRVSTSQTIDAPRMFAAGLFLCQEFGKHLGLQLSWLPKPADDKQIVIAQGVG